MPNIARRLGSLPPVGREQGRRVKRLRKLQSAVAQLELADLIFQPSNLLFEHARIRGSWTRDKNAFVLPLEPYALVANRLIAIAFLTVGCISDDG